MNGFESAGATDEWCDFELVHEPEFEDCRDGIGGFGMLAQAASAVTILLRRFSSITPPGEQQGVNHPSSV